MVLEWELGFRPLENLSHLGVLERCKGFNDGRYDIIGGLEPKKVCITCSGCTELMRGDRPSGCVVRDGKIYHGKYEEVLDNEE